MQIVWIISAALAGLFLLFAIGGGYYMYRFAILRNNKIQKDYWREELKQASIFTDEEFVNIKRGERFIKDNAGELITIESHDGLKLCGHLIENKDPVGLIIMVHGYRSHPVLDFSCAVEPFYAYGYSMLLIDHRAHGWSGGKHIGFGVMERLDIIRWAEYAKKRWPGLPVILDGVSMGGATVMMGLDPGYPDNVKAIIADCGYTSPGAICKKVLRQWFRLPPFPIYYAAKFWVRLLAKYDLDGASSTEALKKRNTIENPPCLLIAHGMKDDFVPYSMAEENRAAVQADDGRFWFVASETAGHGFAFLKDRDLYIRALEEMYVCAGIAVRKETEQK